jgi:ribosomal protein S4E
MKSEIITSLKDGDRCMVTAGTHRGKSGTIRDIHKSKTGAITITVVEKNGIRFKTLGKNVVVVTSEPE